MGLRPRLWHLSALVGVAAVILTLARGRGAWASILLGLAMLAAPPILGASAAYRRADGYGRRLVALGVSDRAAAGLLIAGLGLLVRLVALVGVVAAVALVIGAAAVAFRLCCIDRYVP